MNDTKQIFKGNSTSGINLCPLAFSWVISKAFIKNFDFKDLNQLGEFMASHSRETFQLPIH